MTTLPTPCARDGKGPGHQYGLPDLIEGSARQQQGLLPTPTSGGGTGYMSGNRRDTWRPTLDLAVQGYLPSKDGRPDEPAVLLPTRTVTDGAAAPLPTPRAKDTGTPGHRGGDGFRSPLSQVVLPLPPTPRTSDGRGPADHGEAGVDPRAAVWLLPTPKASDGTKGCPAQRGSIGDLTLPSAAVRLDADTTVSSHGTGKGHRLLPTPRVAARTASAAATTAPACARSRPEGQAVEFADGAMPRELRSWEEAPAAWQPPAESGVARSWGPYADAVARWELVMGRPAPAATQPGKHGKPVLAPPFVEWLMGLNEGWVTDLDLPRTLALRMLGNGVVPQQAAVALRLLLCPHRWAVGP